MDVFQGRLLIGLHWFLGDKYETQQALAQLVDDHRTQGQWVVLGAAIGIGCGVDHHRGHPANRSRLAELAILHAGHEHHQSVVPLIGNHVRRSHADGLRIRKDTPSVIFPHLDEAGQVVPAANIRAKKPAPQDPGDRRQEPSRISLFVEDFDFERAWLDSDQALQPCQELLHNERFLRGLNLRNVIVDAGAGAGERPVVVERPEERDGDHAGHRFAIDRHMVKSNVDPRRPNKPDRPLCRRPVDLVRPRLAFLHDFIGAVGPAAFENVFGVLHGRKNSDRLVPGRAVGLEMGRRGVFKVRHIHRRRTVQRVERHVQRMPRPGELQSGIL